MLATLRSCAPATRVCLARRPRLAIGVGPALFSRQCSQIPVSLTKNSRFSYKGKSWTNARKSGTISAARHAKRARTRKIPDSFPCQREFAGAQTGSSGLRPPPAIPAEFATRLAPLKAGVTSVGYKPAQKMSGPGDRKLTHLLPPLASSSLPAETIFRLSGIQRQQRLVSPASETGSSPALRLFRAASNSIGKSGRPRSELQDNYRRSGAQAAGGAVEVCRRRRRRRRGRDESRLTEDPQRLLKSPGPR